jgi:RimJ/RimL family protein N-acetyltransferase
MSTTPISVADLRDRGLRLRAPNDDDVTTITRLCQDPEIQRWTRVPSPYTEADARSFLQLHADGLRSGTGIHLLVVDTASGGVLGAVGADIDHRDFSAEVGYWVAPGARRRGVASRGARMLLRLLFDTLDVRYVMLHAAVDNPASNAVARKLGFTHEGTSRDAMLIGPTGDPTAPRGDANLWGQRPGELTESNGIGWDQGPGSGGTGSDPEGGEPRGPLLGPMSDRQRFRNAPRHTST